MLKPDDRAALAELAPLLRRSVTLEPDGLARIRLIGASATALVRLPFAVLVSRTVRAAPRSQPLDVTVRAAELLAWIDAGTDASDGDGDTNGGPVDADAVRSYDAQWRVGLPPPSGWRRIESVPDEVVRGLVRTGALALQEAAAREGVRGNQPRAEVADALLDSAVLVVSDDGGAASAEVTLRALSALVRMGFSPRGGEVRIDGVGRWVRVVAEYGTVYLERPGSGLVLH